MILLAIVRGVVTQMIDRAEFWPQQFELVLGEVADLCILADDALAVEQRGAGRQRLDERRFARAIHTKQDNMDKKILLNTADEASKQRSALRAVKVQLYETILRHAEWHPNGTVVILQHAEESSEGLLATLIQDLTQPSRHISTTQDRVDGQQHYSVDNDNSPIPQSLASRLQQACRRTVFIVTSHVGSRTIASSIRSFKQCYVTVDSRMTAQRTKL